MPAKMCIGILDAVFSSANSGIDDSISKLTDFLRIDQAFNLINQRRVSACSEEFFEIEATESCPFNMPWHLDIWNLQVGVETYSPGFVCVYCQIGLCQGAHTHTSSIFAKDGIVISIYFTYESFPLISAVYLFVLAYVGIYPKHTKVIFFITVDIFGRRA